MTGQRNRATQINIAIADRLTLDEKHSLQSQTNLYLDNRIVNFAKKTIESKRNYNLTTASALLLMGTSESMSIKNIL